MPHPLSRLTRRQFLAAGGATAVAAGILPPAKAIDTKFDTTGVQIAWLTPELEKDFDLVLQRLAEIGYRHVELLGNFGRSAPQLLKSLQNAGLKCESNLFWLHSTMTDFNAELAKQLDFAHALGLKYLVALMPLPLGIQFDNPWRTDPQRLNAALEKTTLDDYKCAAELFNVLGARARSAGIQFAYHNFNYEFRSIDGLCGYDELLRLTDADLVKMELDCGWMKAAGQNPAEYLRRYPERFPLLHLKDVKDRDPNTVFRLKPVEVGYGIMDWKEVLVAARESRAEQGYVEFEPPPPLSRPLLESAKLCFDYLQGI